MTVLRADVINIVPLYILFSEADASMAAVSGPFRPKTVCRAIVDPPQNSWRCV